MVEQRMHILLVEDDDVAAEGVIRSLKRAEVHFPVTHALEGREALCHLRGEGGYEALPRPFLVLLDLNMPGMNGFEFLQALRSDPKLRETIVFVLTTSNADEDRTRAYQQFIAGYLVKSQVGPQFKKLVALLTHYGETVCLPGRSTCV